MIASETRFYITGGTLPPGALSYVERQADRDLLAALRAGEYCYVLNSRQMGKSSLCVRTMGRLREEGIRTAFLDLTKFGGRNLTAEQWYAALLAELGRELGLRAECLQYWKEHPELPPVQRLFGAITEVALGAGVQAFGRSGVQEEPTAASQGPNARTPERLNAPPRLVVFIDEIDITRSLPFNTDEFFAAIRQCYVGRATEPLLQGVIFCLLGTATPAELIEDTRISPFNIGRRIEVRDFTPQEAAPLAAGLLQRGGTGTDGPDILNEDAQDGQDGGKEGRRLLERILYWTGGHPYLTQRLCRAVAEANAGNPKSKIENLESVDELCTALFLTHTAREGDDNLALVRNRLLKSEADLASLLDLYGKLRSGKAVADDETNALCGVLKLSGVAKAEDGRLHVRNRIYREVFDREWVQQHMPDAELRRQKVAYRRGLLRAGAVSGVVLMVIGALAFKAQHSESRAVERAHAANVAENRALLAQKTAENERQQAVSAGERERVQRLAAQAAEQRASQSAEAERKAARRADAEKERAEANAGRAYQQEQRAQHAVRETRDLLAQAQLDRGIRRLEGGDSFGLLDLLQARATGAEIPVLRDSAAQVWAGWHAEVAGRLVGVMGQRDENPAMALSPDGKLLAAGTDDGHAVQLWEMAVGRPHGSPLRHADRVWAIVFSPTGRWVATASEDRTVRLWDTATGRPYGPALRHRAGVQSVAFSPDGKLIATGSDDRTAQMWDTATGKPYGDPLRHQWPVRSVSFSPDGKLLAIMTLGEGAGSSSGGGSMRLWEVAGGRPHSEEWKAAQPLPIAFNRDGTRIAISTGSTFRLGNPVTGQIDPRALYAGGGVSILAMEFSPDGSLLATGVSNGRVQLWRVASGQAYIPRLELQVPVRAVAFSPNGKLFATGTVDGNVRLWVTANGQPHGAPLRHPGPIRRVEFSPDGKLLAVGSWDGSVRLWAVEPPTGQVYPSGRPLVHPPGSRAINQVAFSPDGRLLATASDDFTTQMWELATGRPHGPLLRHGDCTLHVTFSPKGNLLATGSWDNTARLWDTTTGRPHGLPLQHPAQVSGLAFSPDGTLLATNAQDGTVRLWETATGRLRSWRLRGAARVRCLAYSPDGKRLATASALSAQLWDVATGHPYGAPMQHEGPVSAVAFSPDGKRLAAGTNAGTVRFWDTVTRQPRGLPLRHTSAVYTLAFNRDGRLLAVGYRDRTARVWECANGQPCGPPRRCLSFVSGVAFSPDGKLLATAAQGAGVRLWRLPTVPARPREMELRTWLALGARLMPRGEPGTLSAPEWQAFSQELRALEGQRSGGRTVRAPALSPMDRGQASPPRPRDSSLSILWGHTGAVGAIAFSPDGQTIVTAGADSMARLWDRATGQERTLRGHNGVVAGAAFTPDGKTVATVGTDRSIRLWDVNTGQERARLPGQPFIGAALSPDGMILATGNGDNSVTLWDLASSRQRARLEGHAELVVTLGFSPDGKTLATGSRDLTVKLWDVAAAREKRTLNGYRGQADALAFSPDGSMLAVASADLNVTLWNAATGRLVGTLNAHTGRLSGLAFSPDSKTLATASHDHTVRLWNVATRQTVHILADEVAEFTSVAFSPDGKAVAAGTVSGEVNVWSLGTAVSAHSDTRAPSARRQSVSRGPR